MHYKFTGKERDSESNLDNFGARYNASTMGRFMTPDPVIITPERFYDPQQLNGYAYVRNNPIRLVDPTGMILQVSGDAAAAFNDLCEVLGDACDRLSVNLVTGVVTLDTEGLDLSKNEGANVINDLLQSANTYDFSVGPTVQTAQGTLRIDYIENRDNKDSHAPIKTPWTPRAGVDDQVAIDERVHPTSENHIAPATKDSVVFHELAEAYAKVDHNEKYGAAHQEAIDREKALRDQRPALQLHNPGSGPRDQHQQIQTEKIIKK